MYFKLITLMYGKKMYVGTGKSTIIKKFLYAMKYYQMTEFKKNKKSYTVKFNNEYYSYTFILPIDFIKEYTEGKV